MVFFNGQTIFKWFFNGFKWFLNGIFKWSLSRSSWRRLLVVESQIQYVNTNITKIKTKKERIKKKGLARQRTVRGSRLVQNTNTQESSNEDSKTIINQATYQDQSCLGGSSRQ